MVEEKNEVSGKESLHHRAERRAVHTIIDAVFGLSLGLGAFSLTELPITNAQDLFVAIGFFGFSYFIIFMSWMAIRVYFEDYVVYGGVNMILFFTGFFIAIMPLPIRIV
jgi:apolipoprotein N-acyltransferase